MFAVKKPWKDSILSSLIYIKNTHPEGPWFPFLPTSDVHAGCTNSTTAIALFRAFWHSPSPSPYVSIYIQYTYPWRSLEPLLAYLQCKRRLLLIAPLILPFTVLWSTPPPMYRSSYNILTPEGPWNPFLPTCNVHTGCCYSVIATPS